jgi:hypothetical protein
MMAAEIFSKNKSQTIFPFFVTLKVTLTMVDLGLQKYLTDVSSKTGKLLLGQSQALCPLLCQPPNCILLVQLLCLHLQG